MYDSHFVFLLFFIFIKYTRVNDSMFKCTQLLPTALCRVTPVTASGSIKSTAYVNVTHQSLRMKRAASKV